MATHLEGCSAVFKEQVAPHFPLAQERLGKYFRESYELIRAMPLAEFFADGSCVRHAFADKKDRAERMKGAWGRGTVKCIDLEVALAFLRIKPLTTIDTLSAPDLRLSCLRMLSAQILQAGLTCVYIPRKKEEEWGYLNVYDPVLAAGLLSDILNRTVTPESVPEALREFRGDMPHSLMGYPESNKSGKASFSLNSSNVGMLQEPDRFYMADGMGCVAYSRQIVDPLLEHFAAAGALVEEMRGSPTTVSSYASLTILNSEHMVSQVRITRLDGVGNWEIQKQI